MEPRRGEHLELVIVLLAFGTGCPSSVLPEEDAGRDAGSDSGADSGRDVGPTAPYFTLEVPAELEIFLGETATLSADLTRANGFSGDVTITVGGLGPEISVAALTVAHPDTTGSLVFRATRIAVPDGPLPLVVRGESATQTATASLGLRVRARPGSLDHRFGQSGGLQYDNLFPSELRIQADGKLVILGHSRTSSTSPIDVELLRLMPDGSIDLAFGDQGRVRSLFGGIDNEASSMELLSDGRIVAAGATGTGAAFDFAIARFLTNGQRDLGFGSGGVVRTDFDGDADYVGGIAVSSDGSLHAVGFSYTSSGAQGIGLARYGADGALDPSFATNGLAFLEFPTGHGLVGSLILLPSGKLVAGVSTNDQGRFQMSAVRFAENGALDASFAAGGVARIDFGGRSSFCNSLRTLPDGRLLLAGFAVSASVPADLALAALLPDGSPDLSFGIAGVVTNDLTGDADFGTRAGAVLPDGRILHGGGSNTASGFDLTLARYLPSGALDTEFGTNGSVITDFGASNNVACCLEINSGGRIVLLGANEPFVSFFVAHFWN